MQRLDVDDECVRDGRAMAMAAALWCSDLQDQFGWTDDSELGAMRVRIADAYHQMLDDRPACADCGKANAARILRRAFFRIPTPRRMRIGMPG